MKIAHETKVLITAGASGIGKLMGKIVLQKEAELIIWDINQEKINSSSWFESVCPNVSQGKVFSSCAVMLNVPVSVSP